MTKHIHILGICGTFMGGLAQLAVEAGYQVSGSDQNVYPPMSDRLRDLGIELHEGYSPEALKPAPDCVIVGNVMSRSNPSLEYVLSEEIPYYSGPQWLYENILQTRQVIAVAGTHGKTTTTSLLVWLLKQSGIDCGYLIGGVAQGMQHSAQLGAAKPFVIEADEYDTAFFDKRSKFLHYHPNIVLLNNLEFDHADIFADLEAIKFQFEILLRMIPAEGTVIYNAEDDNLSDVLQRGCWSNRIGWGEQQGEVRWQMLSADGEQFVVRANGNDLLCHWSLGGQHNVKNATAAITAARQLGVTDQQIILALQSFSGIKRRLEQIACVGGITVYDDFAHHPTAIAQTLAAVRAKAKVNERVIAVVELASNTMRTGVHQSRFEGLFDTADATFMLKPEHAEWDVSAWTKNYQGISLVADDVDILLRGLLAEVQSGDHVVIMSNRSFAGIHRMLVEQLHVTQN